MEDLYKTIKSELLAPIKKWCELSGALKGIVFYGGDSVQNREGVSVLPIDVL